MPVLISVLVTLFLYLMSSIVFAKTYHENYGAKICANDAEFNCYTIKRGDNWDSLFNNEDQKNLVMRINRMNTSLHRGMVIAIPKNLNDTAMMDWAPFKKQINSTGTKIIIVSLSREAFGAYDANGDLVYWGPVSGGRGYCPDIHRGCHSPFGHFAIYQKEGEGCVSTKFPVGRGGAPMPYCMFFHGGFALHGSYEVPGYNASHGCIRMFVNDAQWLNEDFTDDGYEVPVIIGQ